MELTFTKCSGKYDKMEMRRAGRQSESLECPKQGIIPHEMVHYAVESVLKKRGFIARVAEGEAATFTMASEPEAARQCPPLAIGPPDVEAVRRRILELTAQWQAVPVGKSMSLTTP